MEQQAWCCQTGWSSGEFIYTWIENMHTSNLRLWSWYSFTYQLWNTFWTGNLTLIFFRSCPLTTSGRSLPGRRHVPQSYLTAFRKALSWQVMAIIPKSECLHHNQQQQPPPPPFISSPSSSATFITTFTSITNNNTLILNLFSTSPLTYDYFLISGPSNICFYLHIMFFHCISCITL